MFGKGTFLLAFAVLIDFLQLALGWVAFAIGAGLQALTPVGGAAAGAAAGAYACFGTSGGIIQGAIDAAKCGFAGGVFGAFASTFGIPFGTMLGFIFDICISLTLGSGLIFLLALSGMFYPKYIWSGGIFEMMPGFDILPGWTLMVVLSLIKKRGEEKKGGLITAAAKIVSTASSISSTNPVSAMRSVNTFRQTPNQMRSDLRPANDNQKGRTPLNLKSPKMTDIKPYVQKAA